MTVELVPLDPIAERKEHMAQLAPKCLDCLEYVIDGRCRCMVGPRLATTPTPLGEDDPPVHGQTPADTWRYGTWLGYAGLVAALVAAFAAGWCAK